MIVRGTLALSLLLSGACAVNHRPNTTVAALQNDADVARRTERVTRDSVIARLVRRARARGDGKLDVLMLSGGGQNGAFGVGFLRGWRERPDAPMPRFDLVTGISTGAVQAPYALLGTAAAIDTITALYRRAAERIAPTVDWWFWLRRSGGVVNTKRFDRALEQSISGRFRDELHRAFAEDRQLVFGTADFDIGTGRTWSLGDALDTGAVGLVRARTLLKAATAIPGIFPPVVVDGHVHADGGVIANVMDVLQYADYERLATQLAAAGMRDVTIRVFTIMNMWAQPDVRVMSASSVRKIAGRSNELLFITHQPETLAQLSNLARAVTGGIPGLRVDFRVALLPAVLSMEPGARKLFDRAFMQRLEELGFAKSRSASPWDSVPSAYERPPRN